jgi:hypothetical protein
LKKNSKMVKKKVICLRSMIIDENEMETLSNYYISS